ncbi:hypothetical protein [Rhodococcus chondri]|uniref:DUF7159 domain-containing protein n=1 Tax=Rhodococcus chondri TaxID=3065941 RepID=A0ABU7JQG4_9NOCA|nr:hypothetical protein [Rhodococcus sp. CC-R104]MEE2032250.1 hypothetical protein [Rhodococcus sp. CC-R104]
MAIGVGLRIGRIVSTAVVASNEPGTPDPVVIARDTVLHIDHDGTTSLGGSGRSENEMRTLAGFLPRVGEPSGVTASDGRVYRAEDAMATAVHCLLSECHPLPTFGGLDEDTDPGYTATYPSHWDQSTVAALRAALDYAELRHVNLVSDAEAAATWYASEISESPGQLVGVYHVDDSGSTVTLVRSGVPAGKAFRTAAKSAPSAAAQLATALGSFGWLPHNLDAVVVMGDGLIARDRSQIQQIANSLSTKLMVRSLVGPGPEQTAALGAAILAAGFTPARETKARIGLPPSYDETDVLTGGLARLRVIENRMDEVPVVTVTVESDAHSDAVVDPPSPSRLYLIVAAVVVVLLVALVVLL